MLQERRMREVPPGQLARPLMPARLDRPFVKHQCEQMLWRDCNRHRVAHLEVRQKRLPPGVIQVATVHQGVASPRRLGHRLRTADKPLAYFGGQKLGVFVPSALPVGSAKVAVLLRRQVDGIARNKLRTRLAASWPAGAYAAHAMQDDALAPVGRRAEPLLPGLFIFKSP